MHSDDKTKKVPVVEEGQKIPFDLKNLEKLNTIKNTKLEPWD